MYHTRGGGVLTIQYQDEKCVAAGKGKEVGYTYHSKSMIIVDGEPKKVFPEDKDHMLRMSKTTNVRGEVKLSGTAIIEK